MLWKETNLGIQDIIPKNHRQYMSADGQMNAQVPRELVLGVMRNEISGVQCEVKSGLLSACEHRNRLQSSRNQRERGITASSDQ